MADLCLNNGKNSHYRQSLIAFKFLKNIKKKPDMQFICITTACQLSVCKVSAGLPANYAVSHAELRLKHRISHLFKNFETFF
ncbi:hypothetical protein QLG07_23310 [Erwinia sp. V90_4]|nr:hypothetical protein [Erwinia sp. V90_4]